MYILYSGKDETSLLNCALCGIIQARPLKDPDVILCFTYTVQYSRDMQEGWKSNYISGSSNMAPW